MKYICTINEEGIHEIITFPKTINHDVMAASISRMKNKLHGQWSRVSRKSVSAGFIDAGGNCHGESETLRLKSRGIKDTIILKRQFI